MDITEILYLALSTIVVMVVIQIVTFMVSRMLYTPEPTVVYKTITQPAPQPQPETVQTPPNTFTQQNTIQEIKLPEYEPRQQTTGTVQLDAQLPAGLQETRPQGL